MDFLSVETWKGLGLFLAIILSPVAVTLVAMGVQELLEWAYYRGYDRAWEHAVNAQEHGIKLI